MSQSFQIKYTELSSLIPFALNARTHSPEQVAQIAGSIKEFGFTNPILITKDGGIIAGHGRALAAQKLGLKTVPTITLDHLSPTQTKAYVLADNKIALNSGWDEEMLKTELLELQEQGVNIESLGFSEKETEELLQQFNAEGAQLPEISDEEKPPFGQMSFMLHDEQMEEVESAIAQAKQMGHGDSAVNENSNGNALAFICSTFNRMKHNNEG